VIARYTTAGALRAALIDRLRQQSEESGRDLQWLRRRLVFTRILARLVAAAPDAWVLKGGMAVELRRPGLARATRDIDLVLRPGLVDDPSDVEQVREAMLDSLLEDVDGDWIHLPIARRYSAAGRRLRSPRVAVHR
jgi:nucleotidyltransferase AbiEii toxin of type IV toxin-antitoxin system